MMAVSLRNISDAPGMEVESIGGSSSSTRNVSDAPGVEVESIAGSSSSTSPGARASLSNAHKLDQQQPARAFVDSHSGMYRAIHRRPFCSQVANDALILRDIHTLGPFRAEKRIAVEDKLTFRLAFEQKKENGLFQALREMHAQVQEDRALSRLLAWEIEVEIMIGGVRKARAVCRGEENSHRVTILGPWKRGRLLAEQDLKIMRDTWLAKGIKQASLAAARQARIAPPVSTFSQASWSHRLSLLVGKAASMAPPPVASVAPYYFPQAPSGEALKEQVAAPPPRVDASLRLEELRETLGRHFSKSTSIAPPIKVPVDDDDNNFIEVRPADEVLPASHEADAEIGCDACSSHLRATSTSAPHSFEHMCESNSFPTQDVQVKVGANQNIIFFRQLEDWGFHPEDFEFEPGRGESEELAREVLQSGEITRSTLEGVLDKFFAVGDFTHEGLEVVQLGLCDPRGVRAVESLGKHTTKFPYLLRLLSAFYRLERPSLEPWTSVIIQRVPETSEYLDTETLGLSSFSALGSRTKLVVDQPGWHPSPDDVEGRGTHAVQFDSVYYVAGEIIPIVALEAATQFVQFDSSHLHFYRPGVNQAGYTLTYLTRDNADLLEEKHKLYLRRRGVTFPSREWILAEQAKKIRSLQTRRKPIFRGEGPLAVTDWQPSDKPKEETPENVARVPCEISLMDVPSSPTPQEPALPWETITPRESTRQQWHPTENEHPSGKWTATRPPPWRTAEKRKPLSFEPLKIKGVKSEPSSQNVSSRPSPPKVPPPARPKDKRSGMEERQPLEGYSRKKRAQQTKSQPLDLQKLATRILPSPPPPPPPPWQKTAAKPLKPSEVREDSPSTSSKAAEESPFDATGHAWTLVPPPKRWKSER